MRLTDIERESELWKKLTAHYALKLDTYRMQNDGNLSPDETAKLRGKIFEVRKILALGEVTPAPESDDE